MNVINVNVSSTGPLVRFGRLFDSGKIIDYDSLANIVGFIDTFDIGNRNPQPLFSDIIGYKAVALKSDGTIVAITEDYDMFYGKDNDIPAELFSLIRNRLIFWGKDILSEELIEKLISHQTTFTSEEQDCMRRLTDLLENDEFCRIAKGIINLGKSQVEVPQVEVPHVEVPQVEVPHVEVPQVEVEK